MWACTLKFYGPAKVLPLQWEYCREKFWEDSGREVHHGRAAEDAAHGRAETEGAQAGVRVAVAVDLQHRGAQRDNSNPTNGHQWFSPIIPRSGEAVFEANRIFSKAGREHGLPVPPYSIPFTFWERSFLFLFGFPVTHDVAQNRKSREGFKRLVEVAAEHGFGEYRTAPAYQDLIMSTYSFNNHALLRFHETLERCRRPEWRFCRRGAMGSGRRVCGREGHERTTKTGCCRYFARRTGGSGGRHFCRTFGRG